MFNLASICNLYGYEELFKDIEINDALDKELVINTILDTCAMYEPIYPEIEILNMKIKVFFKKHQMQFDKLTYLYSLQYKTDYNPIWNKDGSKTHSEKNSRTKVNTLKNAIDDTVTTNNSNNDEIEEVNQVSAYDSDIFSNDSKTTTTDKKQENSTEKTNRNENSDGNEKEENILETKDTEQGNIGVTTTATMINEEIDLQKKFNVYEVIATMFYDELMLHVAYTNQLPY